MATHINEHLLVKNVYRTVYENQMTLQSLYVQLTLKLERWINVITHSHFWMWGSPCLWPLDMRSWVNPQYPKRDHLCHHTILREMIHTEKCKIMKIGGKMALFSWDGPYLSDSISSDMTSWACNHYQCLLCVCTHAYNRWCITLQKPNKGHLYSYKCCTTFLRYTSYLEGCIWLSKFL